MNGTTASLPATFVGEKTTIRSVWYNFCLLLSVLWEFRAVKIITAPIWGPIWLLSHALALLSEFIYHAVKLYGKPVLYLTVSFVLAVLCLCVYFCPD